MVEISFSHDLISHHKTLANNKKQWLLQTAIYSFTFYSCSITNCILICSVLFIKYTYLYLPHEERRKDSFRTFQGQEWTLMLKKKLANFEFILFIFFNFSLYQVQCRGQSHVHRHSSGINILESSPWISASFQSSYIVHTLWKNTENINGY